MQLTTDRLDLVPLNLDRDLPDLHTMLVDPIWAAAAFAEPTTDPAASRDRLAENFGDNGELTWVLRAPGSSQAIGVIGVYSDQGTSTRGLSWYLRRDHWGQGLMGEAARVVVEHLLTLPGSMASKPGSTRATTDRSVLPARPGWSSSAGCRG
jgi:RimJ/RimL family protein N-acetyltransferase